MDIIDKIEHDVRKMEQAASYTDDIRRRVITKLADVVETIKLNPNEDKPTVTEAKRGVIDTLLKGLNDIDSQHRDIVKIKQRKHADEQNEDTLKAISKTVVEFIKQTKIDLTRTSDDNPDTSIDQVLDQRAEDDNLEILDGELEMVGKTAKDIDPVMVEE